LEAIYQKNRPLAGGKTPYKAISQTFSIWVSSFSVNGYNVVCVATEVIFRSKSHLVIIPLKAPETTGDIEKALSAVHDHSEKKAKLKASASEYLINPLSYRLQTQEPIPYNQSTTKENPMRKLRRLSRILADLDERDIDSDDVVIDPKSVHIVSDEDTDEDEEEE
jgi:hypothetical protein